MAAEPQASWWWQIERLPPAQRRNALVALDRAWKRSRRILYAPPDVRPHPKQDVFLALQGEEAFYGGAAGPGKSTALLLAALQWVDVPYYAALILRRTYSDLALPGALLEVAERWLRPTDAKYNSGTHTWTFPSKATLTFGHLEREATKFRYAGSEFQFIGWDELTQFTENQYTFLFSRLRRPSTHRGGTNLAGVGLSDVPLRVRAASNPGNEGHDWVKARFVEPETREPGAVFIPARMHENPSLDRESYMKSLEKLSPAERERLIAGDWDAADDGGIFHPDVWPLVPDFAGAQRLRWWDLAGTKPTPANPDPDYSASILFERDPRTGQHCIVDAFRFREEPADTESRVAMIADRDRDFYGVKIPVGIEQEPGSAGKALIARYSRHVLRGKAAGVYGIRPSVDKVTRSLPAAAAAGRGEISVKRAPWNRELFAELRRFPNGKHDDLVDCLSAVFEHITTLSGRATLSVPSGRLPGPTGSEPT